MVPRIQYGVVDMRCIHEWLQVKDNYQKINVRWNKPPRILGGNGVVSAGQEEFQLLGLHLASRLEKVIKKESPSRHKPFHFAIIKPPSHTRNAWAFWAADFYGILVTQGLVENIQTVCGQFVRLMPQVMAMEPLGENFLRELWAGMPAENADFSMYGSLLAQIAFDFIVHHELAHAGLGHESIYSGARAIEDSSSAHEGEREWVLAEYSESASASAEDVGDRCRQALEADADLNGLRYTIDFVDHQTKTFKETSEPPEDSMCTVWKHFLTDDTQRWFAIMAGVTIGLGCLLSEQKDRLGDLSVGSHPPLPARMLMLLHAARQLQRPALRASIADVVLLVSTLFSMLRTANGSSTETLESGLGRFNLKEAIERFDEIGHHFKSLATEMRKLAKQCEGYRLFPDSLRWKWYAADATSAS